MTDAKEPSKMSPEDETPPKPARKSRSRKQVVPLTKEQLAEDFRQLTKRARAAGLHPIKTLIQAYARQGTAILEGILDSLDSAGSSKKKK